MGFRSGIRRMQDYSGWVIVEVTDELVRFEFPALQNKAAGEKGLLQPLFLAINKRSLRAFAGSDLPALLADVDEANR